MEEIAAAIPDDLATLRPEDIRVEAEFVDLVVTTTEGITSPAPAAQKPQSEPLAGDPVEVEAYFAQTPPAAELPPVVAAEPRSWTRQWTWPSQQSSPRSRSSRPRSCLRAGTSGVREVVLQPATVLAWSLLVLLAIPMAFLAGLLIGHFLWK